MKKTYEAPQMEVIRILASTAILAGSLQINSTDDAIDAGNAAAPELDDYEF